MDEGRGKEEVRGYLNDFTDEVTNCFLREEKDFFQNG